MPPVRQRQLRGNVPQAFVHAMLIETAQRLDRAGGAGTTRGYDMRGTGLPRTAAGIRTLCAARCARGGEPSSHAVTRSGVQRPARARWTRSVRSSRPARSVGSKS